MTLNRLWVVCDVHNVIYQLCTWCGAMLLGQWGSAGEIVLLISIITQTTTDSFWWFLEPAAVGWILCSEAKVQATVALQIAFAVLTVSILDSFKSENQKRIYIAPYIPQIQRRCQCHLHYLVHSDLMSWLWAQQACHNADNQYSE